MFTRRSFLGRIGLAAAAVLGARAIEAPAVEAAPAEHVYTHTEVERIIKFEREHADQTGWVRGFNDAGPMKMANMADARAEGYADGYTQATQRAESRVAEGLLRRTENGAILDDYREGRFEAWVANGGHTYPVADEVDAKIWRRSLHESEG